MRIRKGESTVGLYNDRQNWTVFAQMADWNVDFLEAHWAKVKGKQIVQTERSCCLVIASPNLPLAEAPAADCVLCLQ